MFQTKVVEKIKTHILCSFFFFWKICCLSDNVEKYGTIRQATHGNIIWYMCIACWITKAIDTHWKYVILICFAMATVVMWTHLSIMFKYTGCPRRNVPDFGRVFLMLKYTDITQNIYVQSWTVREIMAREKCGLLAGPRTVPVSWQVLSMFVLECGVRWRKVSSH